MESRTEHATRHSYTEMTACVGDELGRDHKEKDRDHKTQQNTEKRKEKKTHKAIRSLKEENYIQ